MRAEHPRPRRQLWPTLVISAVIAVLASLLVATPSHAATAKKTYTRYMSETHDKYYSSIKRCVRITLSAKITYTLGSETSGLLLYRSRKVHEPRVTVRTTNTCTRGKEKNRKTQMVVRSHWSSSSCSTSVSIGVGAPWAVNVGVTPACKKAKRAVRVSDSKKAVAVHKQYNTSKVLKFSNEHWKPVASVNRTGDFDAAGWAPLCFKASVTVDALVITKKGSADESYSPKFKACVKHK